jgi:probable HAF family extracellular repeat protein
MKDLGTVGGPDVIGVFVNERGQVAGLSLTDSIPNPSTGIPTQDPFLWENGRMIDLGSLGGVAGGPSALNNLGQVVGQSSDAADPAACFAGNDPENCHPFLWDHGTLVDLNLDTIGGNPLTANAINDAGEIVGGAVFSVNRPFDAYLWKNGVATDLGTLPGDCFSEAFAINSKSQVVGRSVGCDFSTRTFLWDNGSLIDLSVFVPPGSGLQLVEAVAINDRGEIAGDLVPPDCGGGIVLTQGNDTQCGHAFLLILCDAYASADGCRDADAAPTVDENHEAPTAQATTTQPNLTPSEMKDRIRALLSNRNRRFRRLQPK